MTKRQRGEPEFANGLDHRGRPIIPGERRSARGEIPADPSNGNGDEAVGPEGEEGTESEPVVSRPQSTIDAGSANGDAEHPNGSLSVKAESEAPIEID